jgi:hypothetical protein
VKRDIVSGSSLIAGSLAGVLVMTFHPTAHDLLTAADLPRVVQRTALIHAIALASVPVLFLGLLGLSCRLGLSALTTAALVAYGVGGVAVISAAVADGFVAPPMFARFIAAQGEARGVYEALLVFTRLVNQGFAKVDVVASAAAILLWSAALWTSGASRAAGVAGAVVAVGVLLAFFTGAVRLDAHGFGFVTFVQSGWLLWLGLLLCRGGPGRRGQGGVTQAG